MKKKYIVHLIDEQRALLNTIVNRGKHSAQKIKRARVLLLCDEQKHDSEIAEIVGVCPQTVFNIRQRFVEEGFELTLNAKPRSGRPLKLDMKAEAYAIATACTDAPEGRVRWTMQMIADKLVELKLLTSISDETVRRHLKKRK